MKPIFLPVLALRNTVVYPQVALNLTVQRTASTNAVDVAMNNNREIILLPQKNPEDANAPTGDDLYEFGTLGEIREATPISGDGNSGAHILVVGLYRVKVLRYTEWEGCLHARVQALEEIVADDEESKVMMGVAIDAFAQYLKNQKRLGDELIQTLKALSSAGQLADTIVAHLELSYEKRLQILQEIDQKARLQNVLTILSEEEEKWRLDELIRERVKKQMSRNQREYYLNEQIKAIQKELGEMDDAMSDFEQIAAAIEAAKMPPEVHKKAQSELAKLRQMSTLSSEAAVVRGYLEWMCNYPWAKRRRSQYNLPRAEAILERDHYGLKDVKERILEYLAVQKRTKGNNKGSIICLVGPPGVGKTSLGKSIAEATGRAFDRISLGGMRDEAEIRGHRRTYVGALPGKIVQKLCRLESNNPVILLDEIDKMGMDHRGDPASALLEVLDPAQNNAFSDHYLECDIDLSRVLFIATANTLNIPKPLLDRLEIIRIPGYTTREKIEIAQRYIVPRQLRDNGLKEKELTLGQGLVEHIIEDYTREAGVRALEREIGKLARKSVRQLLSGQKKALTINHQNVEQYLGVAKYHRSEEDLCDKIGSVTGLAWTSVGGELLQIETAVFAGKGKLNLTGQMGDVMKESVQAALSVVRGIIEKACDHRFHFNEHDIHMHIPEGATPKDGPSAGIAMATSLLSSLTQIPVRGDIAMTGEITLHGRVLAIGGLKEKLLAAVRGQLRTVLIPEENLKDLRDLPEEIGQALEIIPVKHIDEVLPHALIASEKTLAQRIAESQMIVDKH